MTVLGTVELGGTKSLAAFGQVLDDVENPFRIHTGDPEPTLEAIGDYLDSGHVKALGVASFGPVELGSGHERFGHITGTPKRAWASTDIVGFFKARLRVPIRFDTDVNAAALGEGKWGATIGLRHGGHRDWRRTGHRRTSSPWNLPPGNGAHDRQASP